MTHARHYYKIVLPASDPTKLNWIIDHHTNELTELIKLSRTGTYYSRYYTPDKVGKPDDGLHGSVMAIEAEHVWDGGPSDITFSQVQKPDPFGGY